MCHFKPSTITRQFQCCGIAGLSEFASKLDPIDESCYHIQYIRNGTSPDATVTPVREPNRVNGDLISINYVLIRYFV